MARAIWSEDPGRSRGRLYPEPASESRTPFARDRDRIIHCTAFRRLKGKTQVFVANSGDHFRTRLTHSLEVAQIARSIAAELGLDRDLAETIALGHDLGHPPFAHAGEEALEQRMAPFGGFDHNVQTFRVVSALERRYPTFDGLNLTWESLEGIVKHNGPALGGLGRPAWGPVREFDSRWPLRLESWPSAEAQAAAIADDIAYNNHDVDDGLSAGLFSLADLDAVPLIGPIVRGVRVEHPGLDARLLRLESVRRMIGAMVNDVLAETRARAARLAPACAEEVRALGEPMVGFSPAMAADLAELRAFLHERMYRHWSVNRARAKARRVLLDLFDTFRADPELLPAGWRERADGVAPSADARLACDYIAGMTDRFAIEEHGRLFRLDAWD